MSVYGNSCLITSIRLPCVTGPGLQPTDDQGREGGRGVQHGPVSGGAGFDRAVRISLSPYLLLISLSPYLPSSPYLLISLSPPYLLISLSPPYLLISLSPYLLISSLSPQVGLVRSMTEYLRGLLQCEEVSFFLADPERPEVLLRVREDLVATATPTGHGTTGGATGGKREARLSVAAVPNAGVARFPRFSLNDSLAMPPIHTHSSVATHPFLSNRSQAWPGRSMHQDRELSWGARERQVRCSGSSTPKWTATGASRPLGASCVRRPRIAVYGHVTLDSTPY